MGGDGVVGTLRRGDGARSISVRADMDALPILERTHYDFNDANLPVGAAYWVSLVQRFLEPAA